MPGETLFIKTAFHRIMVAGEFAFLIDAFPKDGGALVVNVGGGAAKIGLESAGKDYSEGKTYKQNELLADSHKFHDHFLQELDLESWR